LTTWKPTLKNETRWRYFSVQCSPNIWKNIALLEGSQPSAACPSDTNGIKLRMSMERWWNDTDRRRPKYSQKYLSQSHIAHHKSHMDWSGIESEPPRWEADDLQPEHNTVLKLTLDLN
jgi:hypothetical protein